MTSKASNRNLRQHVLDELDWDSKIDSGNIGVAVKDGIATLSGHVPSYAQKRAAEQAALRVAGVKGVANEIDVQIPAQHERTDADIARAAVQALEWNTQIPTVKVDGSTVTLEGTVDSWADREDAEDAVWSAPGIMDVTNNLKVSRTTYV